MNELPFINETIKELIAENKISKLLRNPKTEVFFSPLMQHRLYLMTN